MPTKIEQLLFALEQLIEQIDSLEGVEFTRDTEKYKAEACWDYAVTRAKHAAREARRVITSEVAND